MSFMSLVRRFDLSGVQRYRFPSAMVFAAHLILPAVSPATETLHLSADNLKDSPSIHLDRGWKYHSGDSLRWADPAFDDDRWEYADTQLGIDTMPGSGWTGVGWFRIHLEVDSSLWHQTLILALYQAGTSDVYLDGTLVNRSDHDTLARSVETTSRRRNSATFSFDRNSRHVIAIRYSNPSTEMFHRAGFIAGFECNLGRADEVIDRWTARRNLDRAIQLVFTTLAVAFAVLHLILFLFSPGTKGNLYFAVFMLFFAGNIFFDYQSFLAEDIGSNLVSLRIHRAMMAQSPVFILLFIYSLNASKIPRQFWFISAALVTTGVLAVLKPMDNLTHVQIVSVVAVLEILRVLNQAIRRERDGVWIIAIGFMFLFFFSSYDVLLDLHLLEPLHGITNGYPFGFVGLMLSMSIYLARDFAMTNKKLVEQEIQQRVLEAENSRTSKELEDARDLQLSMLPRVVPTLPHLDIAVYMKTATEVGGDYYDFHVGTDGTLTVAVGDATGHGARAGTMVTITKSLFHQLANTPDLREIFEECTRTIKLLNLDQLYMAMTLVRIHDHRMIASAAGMPPITIYRADSKTVDQLVLKGMPLGGFSGFPYQEEERRLSPGDTVVLMSDGLPERFNNEGETLEYSPLSTILEHCGDMPPQEIIHRLVEAGDTWANGKPQDDDVTLVVLKVTR